MGPPRLHDSKPLTIVGLDEVEAPRVNNVVGILYGVPGHRKGESSASRCIGGRSCAWCKRRCRINWRGGGSFAQVHHAAHNARCAERKFSGLPHACAGGRVRIQPECEIACWNCACECRWVLLQECPRAQKSAGIKFDQLSTLAICRECEFDPQSDVCPRKSEAADVYCSSDDSVEGRVDQISSGERGLRAVDLASIVQIQPSADDVPHSVQIHSSCYGDWLSVRTKAPQEIDIVPLKKSGREEQEKGKAVALGLVCQSGCSNG